MKQPEVWKEAKGYSGKYLVSSFGKVKNFNNKRVPVSLGKQYRRMRLRLTINNTTKQLILKKLVFDTFVKSINDRVTITHIDNDETNCRLDNLYVTFGHMVLFDGYTDTEQVLKEITE